MSLASASHDTFALVPAYGIQIACLMVLLYFLYQDDQLEVLYDFWPCDITGIGKGTIQYQWHHKWNYSIPQDKDN